MKYDIVIIGGGPTGINIGIACEKAGLDYVILEKGVLVNSLYNFPVNMTFFSTSKKLEIGNVPFISHTDKPTRGEALEYYRRLLEAYNLKIELGCEVKKVNGGDNKFSLETSKGEITAKKIIIATGFYDTPRMLNVPGEGLPKVKHYFDDVHLYIKKNVAVIGGANSACDVALECWQKGANVTMIVRGKELYQKVKYWILPNIENRIKEGSIKAHFESEVTEIQQDKIIFNTPEGKMEVENDYVLSMTGYKPHLDWFKEIGVKLDDKDSSPILDDNLETSTKGIFIAGVAAGGLQTSSLFIENTRNHPELILQAINL